MNGNKKYIQFSVNGNPFGSQEKLLAHPERLGEFLYTGDTKVPIFMEIFPTDVCNMECNWCISGTRKDPDGDQGIPIKAMNSYFRDYARMGGKAVTFSGGGEPTVYRHFEEAVKTAKGSGLVIGLMTNGMYKESLNKIIAENFEWMRISIDTFNPDNYGAQKFPKLNDSPEEVRRQTRKGKVALETILRNIEALGNIGGVKIGLNCNIGEYLSVEEAKQLVDFTDNNHHINYLQFRPILPRNFKKEEEIILKNQKVWDYLSSIKNNKKINLSDDKKEDIAHNNQHPYKKCLAHFFEPIIDGKGNVRVCSYLPWNDKIIFGNIIEESFEDIWNGEKRKKAVEYVTQGFDFSMCQVCCKGTELNKLLDHMTRGREGLVDPDFL